MSEKVNAGEDTSPQTPLEVLRSAVQRIAELERDVRTTPMYTQRDSGRYETLIRLKAEVVAGLPAELDKLSKRGIPVPDEITSQVFGWAAMAKRDIEANNRFGMVVSLIPQGSKIGEPNVLERLIESLENPKI